MKVKVLVLLIIPFLIGCKEKPYDGPKITLEYAEEGKLISSNVTQMKDLAFDLKIDSIFYIGDETCAACVEFKQKLVTWCSQNHADIYYIQVTEMTEEDSNMLADLTVGSYYEWKDKNTIPTTYFMMQGEIVFRGESSNTINYLNKYVAINQ